MWSARPAPSGVFLLMPSSGPRLTDSSCYLLDSSARFCLCSSDAVNSGELKHSVTSLALRSSLLFPGAGDPPLDDAWFLIPAVSFLERVSGCFGCGFFRLYAGVRTYVGLC